MMPRISQFLLWSVFLFALNIDAQAQETPASLSVGAVRDRVEGGAIRILAKLGDTLSVSNKLVPHKAGPAWGSFLVSNRALEIDGADDGKFGGVSFRYGMQYYAGKLSIDPKAPGTPLKRLSGLLHVVSMHVGADADRSFNNRDYLAEVGYMPVYIDRDESDTDGCGLALGVAPLVAISGQVGRAYRSDESAGLSVSGENSATLRRIKIEGRWTVPLGCYISSGSSDVSQALFGDIGSWELSLRSRAWRDLATHRTYKKHEIVLRIPAGNDTYLDLRRDVGAAPSEYDTGAKFGANVTVEF